MNIEYIESLVELLKRHNLSELDYSSGEESIRLVNSHVKSDFKISKGDIKTTSSVESNEDDNKNRDLDSKNSYIKSNMVGTFYSKPSPDDEEYANVGKFVKKGDTVCIIESMKMMNEVKAPFDCEILELFCKDGDIIEYGQDIFCVKEV